MRPVIFGGLLFALATAHDAAPLDEPWWHCKGPVQDCTSADKPGTYACAEAMGVSSTEDGARRDGLYDCQLQLQSAHKAAFTCRDASPMKCWKDTNGQ